MTSQSHTSIVLSNWDKFLAAIATTPQTSPVVIDGTSLDLASVVAVARYEI